MFDKKQALSTHRKKVASLSESLRVKECVTFRHAQPSHTARANSYKKRGSTLDLTSLQSVVYVDVDNEIALAEPGVTMQELVRATLKKGFLPQVVPEFRTITVGGAIAGAGAESSSHKFGLFSDACLWYEVLLGDGEVLKISKKEHSDLFFSIVGSYGSLAIITLAAIKLIPAKPFVHMQLRQIDAADKAIERLISSSSLFTDGLCLPDHSYLVMQAEMHKQPDCRQYRAHARAPWFYQYLRSLDSATKELAMPTEEYLFRYDRGAFWMGQYVLPLSLVPAHFFGYPTSLDTYSSKIGTVRQCPKWPSWLFRLFFGWCMSSHRLYKRLHALPKELIAHTYVIQDCCLPASSAQPFLETCQKKWGIQPLWLCPIRKSFSSELFAPHSFAHTDSMAVNVGLYGAPVERAKAVAVTREIEEMTQKLGGRKVLYSYSYYDEDDFWSIYDKKRYIELRKKYNADRFVDITQKVLQA